MAIVENDLIESFGTQTDLTGSGTITAIGVAGFSTISATTGLNSWTNTDDALTAKVVFVHQYAATAPADGSVYNIYARKLNVEGTRDDAVPTANTTGGYVGSLTVDGDMAYNSDQVLTGTISLPNVESQQEYEFYLENTTGYATATNWEFFITPTTVGPHPA